jgi:hypothetical protein
MTGYSARLTDELLRRSLVEMAAGPDAGQLLTEVMRTVDATAQVRRRPWDTRGWGRYGVLLAAALLIAAAIGTAVALSRPQPAPQPTPVPPGSVIRVTDFFQWFSYRLPSADAAMLTSGPRGYSLRDGSRELQLFDIWTQNVSDPVSVVLELESTWGACIDRVRPAELGNLPAISARFTPGAGVCSALRFREPGIGTTDVVISDPSTLLVAQTSHGMLGVLISAPTAEGLAAWAPIAMAYVDSFEFTTLNSFDNAP